MMAAPPGNPGRTVYFDWIKALTEEQEARKEKLEARGVAVVTVSGTLVTLLFGLAALATRATSTYTLPNVARDLLYVALILFGVSAVLAILTNIPILYEDVDPQDVLLATSDDYWQDSEADAEQRIAVTRANNLIWNSKANTLKAVILVSAVVVQIAAVVFVALAVAEVLKAAPVR
jgi:hypothetical protein